MFLDEQLLQTCRDYSGTKPEDIQGLNVELCRKCEAYYKPMLKRGQNARETKVILDRLFNLWDSFIRMALKDDNGAVVMMGVFFEMHSFKSQFLNNEEIKKIYNSL